MIVVRITMNVIPEKQKELVQTILSMIEPMEKKKGCLSCEFFCSMENEFFFSLIQAWRTRKNLDQHLRSDMFGVLLGTKSLLIEPHGFHIYTIHKSEGMDAIHAARGI